METKPDSYERTLYEARLDAEAYAVAHELHARLYRRARTLARVLITVSGSAAFGGWLATRPDVAGVAGLVIAVLVALEQALDLSERIARHRIQAQRYADLRRESHRRDMTVSEFDDLLESIKGADEAGLDALLVRAFNRVVIAAGRPAYQQPESRWHRFVAFFA